MACFGAIGVIRCSKGYLSYAITLVRSVAGIVPLFVPLFGVVLSPVLCGVILLYGPRRRMSYLTPSLTTLEMVHLLSCFRPYLGLVLGAI